MGYKRPVVFYRSINGYFKYCYSIFQESYHELCLWHIFQNAAKNLGKTYANIKSWFQNCIYDPKIVEEFKWSWQLLLKDYELTDNEWLQELYKVQEKWAHAYKCDHFCASMTITQRSKSINQFLKNHFCTNIILCEFVKQYSKAMADRQWRIQKFMLNRALVKKFLKTKG